MMCSLEPATMISLMLNSVLPLELAQDIYQSTKDVARMRHCALLLTAIFSSGEPMPVHYFAQLGSSFLNFLLDYVEAPPTADDNNEIPDVFVGLICAYNLQFSALSTNVTVACLADRSGA